MRAWGLVSVSTVAIIAAASPAVVCAQVQSFNFDIAEQSLSGALRGVGRISHEQVVFDGELVRNLRSPALKGAFTVEEALTRLLAGTGLEAKRSPNGAWRVTRSLIKSNLAEGPAEIVEVVVTGSHIRDANPTSPVHAVTRRDIEASGYSQIGDLMRSLPENFSGGQNPAVLGAASSNIGNQNVTNATMMNLRGLGSDATLTLLNGHRLASDAYHQGTDISGIPLSLIQRIEVVTDGASALYGADAVAGVVNIITRKNYEGAQFGVRLGGATQGGANEQTYSVLYGTSIGEWRAIVSLEHSKLDAVKASQRGFTSDVTPNTTLLQPNTTNTAYVSLNRSIGDFAKISFEGIFRDRDATAFNQARATSAYGISNVYSPNANIALSAELKAPRDWIVNITGVSSTGRNSQNSFTSGTYSQVNYKNRRSYAEIVANGSLLQIWSGQVKAAFGIGRRSESLDYGLPGKSYYITPDRNITYGFAEFDVPLLRNDSGQEIDLSLAARSESYSDMGVASTPKIGLRYRVSDAVTLRGTWGKSFKAPSFIQMYQASNVGLFAASILGYSGSGTAILLSGGNKTLEPERSESWTLGGDYKSRSIDGLILSLNYFNVSYDGRVIQPISPATTALRNPLFSPFIEWNPSQSRQQEIIALASTFTNNTGSPYDPANVVAVVRNNYHNATSQNIDGLDLAVRKKIKLHDGDVSIFGNATVTDLRRKLIVTSPEQELSGTVFNVPTFKARAGVSWESGNISTNVIANYIGKSTDTGVTPNKSIGAWTTIDANISYRFADQKHRLSISASNILDRDPPHVTSAGVSYSGMSFDSTNASVIGRVVSLSFTRDF